MKNKRIDETNDPAALLKAAERYGVRTRERALAGSTEFSALVLALLTAALITGTAYHGHWFSRIGAAAILVLGGVTLLRSMRSRVGLGAPISVQSWVVVAALFICDLVTDLALNGTARDVAMATSLSVAMIVLAWLLHARWLFVLSACLVVIWILGFTVLSDLPSPGSFILGITFGLGSGWYGSRQAKKRKQSESAVAQ